LNITVPEKTTSSDKIPVFVFVHGGGFFIGSGNWPEYDCTRLVKRSTALGTPIIGVTIKFVILPYFLSALILIDIATAWALQGS